jgi:hypothetical protein
MKYKLSKTKAKEFAIALNTATKDLKFISPKGAIRNGCFVKYFSVSQLKILSGTVSKSTYGGGESFFGGSKNLHFFTIQTENGPVRVRGKNLYPFLLEHNQGAESLKT